MNAAQTLDRNPAYILCGRQVNRGNGFMTQFEAYQHQESGEIVIERTMFKGLGEVIDFNQTEPMDADKANQLWAAYTV
ncbi:hypothetical protein FW755_12790, partial [Lonepinella koalarum]|uniref:hypothetical protein n=1 Tax=Lonepinella koalarum TaxID=53417 RepID=UPI0011E4796F